MKASLFRFVVARPPQKIADEDLANRSVATHPPEIPPQTEIPQTAFLQGLMRFRSSNDRAGMQKHSQDYISAGSPEYINSLDELETPIAEIDKWIIEKQPSLSTEAFFDFIKSLLNVTIADFIQSDDYLLDRRRVADSLLARYMVGDPKLRVPAHLTRAMRLFGLLEQMVKDEKRMLTPGAFQQALKAFILLPAQLYPLPRLTDKQASQRDKVFQKQREAKKALEARAQELAAAISRHETAITEIMEGYETDLMLESESTGDEALISNEDNAAGGRSRQPITIARELPVRPASLYLSAQATHLLSNETRILLTAMRVPTDRINVVETVSRLENRVAELSRDLHQGSSNPPFVMIGSTLVPAEDYANPGNTYELPDEPTGFPLPDECEQPAPENPVFDGDLPQGPGEVDSLRAPYGELMVVEQTLERYELGEIAHIENVLKGERKVRTHRRSQTTEEVLFVETERTEETERDLQTTERFELQSETEKVINEDTSMEAGLNVAGKYGPMVEFSANASFARDTAVEESHRTATNYSRDVTERAVSRLQERVLEQRTRRVVIEVEETNEHTLNNAKGPEHIAGVYRWVDKVYQAQVVNYGQREMFELIIPEPAAFLKFAMAGRTTGDVDLEKPTAPGYCQPGTSKFVPLQPHDLSGKNYMFWISRYQVAGVEPPPPLFKIVGKAYENSNVHKGYDTQADNGLRVPAGYEAKQAWIVRNNVHYEAAEGDDSINPQLLAYVGQRFLNKNPKTLSKEDGDMPISLIGVDVLAYVANIEITCRRSSQAMEAWQLATYNAIMLAYNEQLAEYEERIAALDIVQGVAISGNNPQRNQQLIRDELKRNAISIFTNQHFDDFKALRKGVGDLRYPQLDLSRVSLEGPFIRFFEQAFEWEHMAYLFYPYFWGRKDDWTKNILLDDNDPLFAQFLRAGAARVVVPVRPGFEAAVSSYALHGWQLVDDANAAFPDEEPENEPPWLSLIAEVQAQQGYDGSPGLGTLSVAQDSAEVTGEETIFKAGRDNGREIHILGAKYRIASVTSETEITLDRPYEGSDETGVRYALGPQYVGEPWEVRVPTSLVYLENDSTTLPTFS